MKKILVINLLFKLDFASSKDKLPEPSVIIALSALGAVVGNVNV